MSLTAGTRLGPYEVVASLGAGGMGEVYRARDTTLGREVAIKVLPEAWARDADRLARFEREARVLASLNHPNIATIHGVEAHAGHQALVLELVEGPTLADLIANHARATPAGDRALPMDDALRIARQVALALEAAHEAGIVHRDLKPANVKVRPDGTVKVLDFGLAKALALDPSSAAADEAVNSPTIMATAMGVLLGTVAYMAPEQARGRATDRRADVWAFGCVLFEMLTGRPAFAGDSVTDTLAAVVRGDPAWETLPADTPVSVRRLLRRCLVRERRDRLSDIGVARLEIDDAFEPATDAAGAALAPAPARSRLTAVGAVALALASVASIVAVPIAVRHVRETPVEWPTVRLVLEAPDGMRPPDGAAVSPDGRFVVFGTVQSRGQPSRLWLRALDAVDARELPGTDGAITPFWSPDSRAIAFFAGDTLRRLDVSGGPVQTVASTPQRGAGGAWSPDGTIIYGSFTGLWRVPASGGEPVALTSFDGPMGTGLHGGPQFLPDGRRFLFSDVRLTAGATSAVFLGSLDGADPIRVIENGMGGAYAPPGYLVFARQATLMAQPFDVRRGAVRGEPVPLVFGETTDSPAAVAFSVSTNGVLVYRPPLPVAPTTGSTLVWVSREGREAPLPALAMERVEYPRLSPDGRRVAFVADGDIWVADLAGRPPIRLTFGGTRSSAFSPLWTPDGRSLVYETMQLALWSLPADGSSSTPTRVSPEGHYHPHGWSADGRDLIAVHYWGLSNTDIVALPFGEPGEARPLVATPAMEGSSGASMSPDGRWLAYVADPTGEPEIWVRPYPGPGAPVRVSPGGGREPVWSRDGRALFYRAGDRLLSVAVESGPEFRFAPPEPLFESADYVSRGQPPSYDVGPDGRFLMLKRSPDSESEPAALPPPIVILNWVAELERRSPG